jgi:site-specific DNA recombinase
MIAAIYARKSTEQAVADDAKSVTRQIEHARQYAARKGWTVSDHIYTDDAISGSEFSRRPGFVRLMSALRPRAPFDALIVSELSRLGREQLETGYALKQLAQAGVRIFAYLDDREILLDTPTDKFLIAAVNFAAEIESAKAAQRVTDAMMRNARAGRVCGGQPFGYRNREVFGPDGRRSHVDREVHEPEAAIVRRIFQLSAEGKGQRGIAKLLNEEGVLAPRPKCGRPRSWSSSSVWTVLHNETYRGLAVWNKRKRSDPWGQRARRRRPEAEWIRTEVPHWRVVSDEQWTAAHQRVAATAAAYLRATNGQRWGRPPSGGESKYLLSGFLRCALCGASLAVHSTSQRRQTYYVCASFHDRGSTVCANGLRLPLRAADEEILTKIKRVVLDRDIVTGAIADVLAALRPSRDAIAMRRGALESELRALDRQQGNLVSAIGQAGQIDALVTALKTCEGDRLRVQRELAALEDTSPLSAFDARRIERELMKRLTEWRGLLGRQTPLARQLLGTLLTEKIAWTPRRDEGVYAYAGRARFAKIFEGIVLTAAMVPVRGFEPRSRG